MSSDETCLTRPSPKCLLTNSLPTGNAEMPSTPDSCFLSSSGRGAQNQAPSKTTCRAGAQTLSGGQDGGGKGHKRFHPNHHPHDAQVSRPCQKSQQQLSKCMGGGKGCKKRKDRQRGNQPTVLSEAAVLTTHPCSQENYIRKRWPAAKTQSTEGGTCQ